jgi:hypothetical protein
VTLTEALRSPTATVPKSITFEFTVTSARAGALNASKQITARTAPRIFVPIFVAAFMFVLVFSPVSPLHRRFVEVGWAINAAHVSSAGHLNSTGEVNRFGPAQDRRRRTGANLPFYRKFARAVVEGSW